MVEASITDLPFLRCNRLEGQRQGPSYTWDTLLGWSASSRKQNRISSWGSPDFALLPTWHRGPELPGLCNFVVSRDGQTAQDVIATAWRLWPEAREPLRATAPVWPCPAAGWRIFALALAGRERVAPAQLVVVGREGGFSLLPRAAFEILEAERENRTGTRAMVTEPTC